MRETYKSRREKMCAFLRTIDPKTFDINYFKKETDCGTVCCIAGYCPIVWPNRFIYTNISNDSVYKFILVKDTRYSEVRHPTGSMEQVAAFFGFSEFETRTTPLDPEYYVEMGYLKDDEDKPIHVDIETACKAIMECEYVK